MICYFVKKKHLNLKFWWKNCNTLSLKFDPTFPNVRIPGGSEDGNTHTARERFCGQALGFCRVQVRLWIILIFWSRNLIFSMLIAQVGKTVDCNAALGAVISYAKPFVLGVVTDMDEGK